MDMLRQKKVVAVVSSVNEQRKMQQTFNDIFRPR